MTETVTYLEGVKEEPKETESDSIAEGKMTTSRRSGKRGRKPTKIDVKAKLERSRQSARECRARKKLRYQYLEELVNSREKAIFSLRRELEMYKKYTHELDEGKIPPELQHKLAKLKELEEEEEDDIDEISNDT